MPAVCRGSGCIKAYVTFMQEFSLIMTQGGIIPTPFISLRLEMKSQGVGF